MTNEEIYENVMGHKPNKEFGIKGSFGWDDIDALMTAVKNCSIPAVVEQKELLKAFVNWQINGRTPYAGMLINEHIEDFLKCPIML